MAYNQDFVNNFQALSDLLSQADALADDAAPSTSRQECNPASIGPKELLNVKVPAPRGKRDAKEIWSPDEVTDPVDEEFDDSREVPEYEFMYKQAVQSTDAFLGMSGKDPSSTCCEDMVVKIMLPKEKKASDVDLDVKPTYLKLSSSIYRLSIFLPHKVDDQKGKAKFDLDKKILMVTLPIIREFD